MTDFEIDVPGTWQDRSEASQQTNVIAEYQRETSETTTFIVSVARPPGIKEEYELRVSTVNLTSTHLRHDYPVERYESRTDAIGGTESFLEQLSRQLRGGSISSDDPEMEEIRAAIRDVTGNRSFLPVRRLVRRIR